MWRRAFPATLALVLTVAVVSGQDTDFSEDKSDSRGPGTPFTTESLMQREVDRRKENTFRYNEILDSADRLFEAGEWDQAKKKFGFVRAQTSPSGPSAGFHRRARVGLAKCLAAEALQQQDADKPAEAANLMRQASTEDPDNAVLAKQAARMQEAADRVLEFGASRSDPAHGFGQRWRLFTDSGRFSGSGRP